MKLSARYIPNGALPYETVVSAVRPIAKLYQNTPFIPVLPKIDAADNIQSRTLVNIPGIITEANGKIFLKPDKNYEEDMKNLDKAFNNPTKENLAEYGFEAPFMEKYFQMLKKFKPANAYINILGPFTLSQIITNAAEMQMIADKSYRKLFVQAVCIKALWLINKTLEYSENTVPIVVLEEPLLNRLGDVKRNSENVSIDLVVNMFTKVVQKIHTTGSYVSVQCFEKCDWQIPIKAGVDMISFNAYDNPNNLNIIPEIVLDFISSGGKINWAIVPSKSENIIRLLNIDTLKRRLFATMEGLIMSGVPQKFVYNSSTVSIQGNMDNLHLIFAEKAMLLCNQLAKSIPVKS